MDHLNNMAITACEREAQLQETINSYRALIAASGIGAWEYHIDTGHLNCNDIYFTMLGKETSDRDQQGRSDLKDAWVNLLHPQDLIGAKEKFLRFLSGNAEESYEHFFRLSHPVSGWIWIWSRGKLIRDNAGRPVRAIGTHMDVNRQKEAEQHILNERLLLRTLIDNLPDTIYVKDKEGRKVIANIADVRSIGAASEADVIGKTDLELFSNKTGRRGYEDDLSVLRSGEAILNKEEPFTDADGTERWLLTSKIPVLSESGEVVQLLGIGHDITRRKTNDEAILTLNKELEAQAEHLIRLNGQLAEQKEQELEKALAQGKFEIASEVLHDIGNALVGFGSHLTRLNKISMLATTEPAERMTLFLNNQKEKITETFGPAKAAALIDLSASLAAAQQKNKDDINATVKELLHIVSHIQEILNIQRQFVRGRESKSDRKPVDMQRITEDCRSMLQANFTRKGIVFNRSVAPGRYYFNGDPTKIMQVMLNILKNAVEAIPVEAAKKSINLTLEIDGEWIELKLMDSGIGFNADTAGHLFQRGFTTKESGTGLGLYNCRSIIESHNGHFMIHSNGIDQGSVVRIRLPKIP